MAPEFMQRFSRNAELDTAEIAGREGGEKLLGKDKALELLAFPVKWRNFGR